ncbi:hydroxyneurosporene synthase (CrtC) [Clostridium puniceum]|uniref:Hydroxyneurosporene synthase (CrtC) n=1 Tax=Clostridium puniceum TaxID=29367 RepID=A0A1S8T7J5_9CLOT|nr:lipocalin family protein [Clostridium puniceum]OOM73668.1 hydroxyneurosporene synthase (CrtC) [Clostridium puniceum]
MKKNQKTLLENLGENGKGIVPFVKPVEDLYWKKDFNNNSWFVIGHFEAEEHKLNFLVHLMILDMKDQQPIFNSMLSITNETTGWYSGEYKLFPLSDIEISDKEFNMKALNASMSGSLDRMHIQATMPNGKVDVMLSPVGYPLYNGGTGYFPMFDMNIYQYSLPTLDTIGTITIEDKTYEINGTSWFDRQWQKQTINLAGHWSWMDINLDNGDKISLWDTVDHSNGNENAWATILHPDGSQSVVSVEPLSVGESNYWLSTKSGQRYPTHWIVKIPSLDACLEVTPVPREQELIAELEIFNKYEGASTVKGTYKGKETTGYCYVELVGSWK